jgi:23S rRNA pseudouridine2457 synthase
VQVDGVITQEAINILKEELEIGFDGGKYTAKTCEIA